MKGKRIVILSAFVIFLLFSLVDTPFLVTSSSYEITYVKEYVPDNIDDDLGIQCGDGNHLRDKIRNCSDGSWVKSSWCRRLSMIIKVKNLFLLIKSEKYEEAYDLLLYDIKPKLTGLETDENEEPWDDGIYEDPWIQSPALQELFRLKCNRVLLFLKEKMEPEPYVDDDKEAPEIILTPASMEIYDSQAVGGIPIEWQISDMSGISEAMVLLNGVEIASYGVSDSISDSYLLPNLPGEYVITITARDNDIDLDHPEGDDWLESSAESIITIIDDDIEAPNVAIIYDGGYNIDDSGVWNVQVADSGAGLDSVIIEVDGITIIEEDQLGGIQSKSYQVDVPAAEGRHIIEVTVIDNDDNWVGDQQEITITDDVDIAPGDPIPGMIIIGAFIVIGGAGAFISVISIKKREGLRDRLSSILVQKFKRKKK